MWPRLYRPRGQSSLMRSAALGGTRLLSPFLANSKEFTQSRKTLPLWRVPNTTPRSTAWRIGSPGFMVTVSKSWAPAARQRIRWKPSVRLPDSLGSFSQARLGEVRRFSRCVNTAHADLLSQALATAMPTFSTSNQWSPIASATSTIPSQS